LPIYKEITGKGNSKHEIVKHEIRNKSKIQIANDQKITLYHSFDI
jgi:hypothetical protein